MLLFDSVAELQAWQIESEHSYHWLACNYCALEQEMHTWNAVTNTDGCNNKQAHVSHMHQAAQAGIYNTHASVCELHSATLTISEHA